MKYIIQQCEDIGKTENISINVLTSEQIQEYIQDGFKYKERIYKLTSGHRQYEVICAEIWKKGDKEHSLIIPTYLILHRAYPIYVYIYAINLYGKDPQKSQRKVAEETREKFGLKTFAHTTVGRAMKTLAVALAGTVVVNNESAVVQDIAEQGELNQVNEGNSDTNNAGRFPTIHDTKTQREIIKSFFYCKLSNRIWHGFKEACDYIAVYWYEHFNRLLI